jgi:hypothetical protein
MQAPLVRLARLSPVLLLLPPTLVLVLACDDSSSGASPAASASAPPSALVAVPPPPASTAVASASAGPPLPKCPAGLTGNAVPAFCIKLPASYAVKDARITPAKGSIAYDTGVVSDNLMISYDDTAIPQLVKDVTGEMKFGGDKLEKSGDLPGGGKWFQGAHQDYERIVTLIKGPSPLTLKCSFTYKPASAPSKDAIDACKSIVVP